MKRACQGQPGGLNAALLFGLSAPPISSLSGAGSAASMTGLRSQSPSGEQHGFAVVAGVMF